MPKDVPAQRFWALAQFFPFRCLAAFHRDSAHQAALLQDFGSLAQGRLTEFDVVVALSFFDEGSHFGNGCLASVLVM